MISSWLFYAMLASRILFITPLLQISPPGEKSPRWRICHSRVTYTVSAPYTSCTWVAVLLWGHFSRQVKSCLSITPDREGPVSFVDSAVTVFFNVRATVTIILYRVFVLTTAGRVWKGAVRERGIPAASQGDVHGSHGGRRRKCKHHLQCVTHVPLRGTS